MTNPQLKHAPQNIVSTATARQQTATDALKSVWVGASAGTGKTKVLIDRLLRLMLPREGAGIGSATPPEKILCLTFTKTGAAEMSERIHAALADFSVKKEEKLREDLEKLLGRMPNDADLKMARRLFARVLETGGGLQIMTIHSFCQSVLKRFPIEAGLPPHFELMDDTAANDLLSAVLHDLLRETKAMPETPAAKAVTRLILEKDLKDLKDLLKQIVSKRAAFLSFVQKKGGVEGAIAALFAFLKIDPEKTEADILKPVIDVSGAREVSLKKILWALEKGSVQDRERAWILARFLSATAEERVAIFSDYHDIWRAKTTNLVKEPTKGTLKTFPDILPLMEEEFGLVEEINARLSTFLFAKRNASLLRVAAHFLEGYEARKAAAHQLDYEDLIFKTAALLQETSARDWVLYKMDARIDHILVDEAQDTSPYQWQIVEALAEDFFSGKGTRDETMRTLFIVGDEKQSIFSFQGADPEEFSRRHDFFQQKVQAVQEGFDVFLDHSFRSTRAVLQTVDEVFRQEAVRQGVSLRDVLHLATREGHAGLVELRPLFASDKPETKPWEMPVAAAEGSLGVARLAKDIAGTIRGWLDRKEILESRGRPIRAGDILILVQSRNVIVEALIRALKDANVPVSGVDRLTLTENIAVLDLLAAARFALLETDDLTLAALLKSPMIGLSEEALYNLCHGRKGTLFSAVRENFPDIAAFLSNLIQKAGRVTPYEFFSTLLLTPCPADPISGQHALFSRLGADMADALDEFLNRCLSFEQSETPTLQSFVESFSKGEAEIKREHEEGARDEVRIMTVHASKGLQAPIVFLPDTVRHPARNTRARPRLLWPSSENDFLLFAGRKEEEIPFYTRLRAGLLARQEEEYRRLLYVAMTRAEDRLYISGYYNKEKPHPECWYHAVVAAMERLGEKDGDIWRYALPQTAPPEDKKKKEKTETFALLPLPEAFRLPPPPEKTLAVPLAPSRPGEDEQPARSPLDENDEGRFARGILIHRVLELLPNLPRAEWEEALERFLAPAPSPLSPIAQKSLPTEIFKVLDHPEFKDIFGPASRAEVSIAGLTGKTAIAGQIDRLVIRDHDILIVDYKTNRPPPKDVSGVPVMYLKQMAAYRLIIQKVYPAHVVRTALLWTDVPFLMPLPDKLLDPYNV